MFTCDTCKKDSSRLKFKFSVGFWQCSTCFSEPPSLYSTTPRLYTDGTKGAISPAHADDIKRRVVGPDGQVFKDRGRKYFVGK